MIEIKFPIKTVSEANMREHWASKGKRKRQQQHDFHLIWLSHSPGQVDLPCDITFVRYSCRTMDQDNLAGAFKHVQDQLAREIGVDDGNSQLRFDYQQKRIKKMDHYFVLKIE